jgi:tetratricopeptide (TPR) repeat protein
MSLPDAFKYRAFLSYSHADTSWAKWLQGRLEGFRLDAPTGQQSSSDSILKSLRPIFRDRDEFTAGQTLSEQTQAALDASAALIVLCSPNSARSHYVNEEVRLFKARHGDRPVIPVIAAGSPDSIDQQCFPPALKFEVAADGSITNASAGILAADLRDTGDGKDLALAKVVARLLGLGTDEVFHRAQRLQRRRQRNWIIGLSAVAAALAGLAVLAEVNRRDAVDQRHIADIRRQEAERNFTAAKSASDSLVFDIAQSLRSVEGMRTETVRKILERAEQVLAELVRTSGENNELLRSQGVMFAEFSLTYEIQGDVAKQMETAKAALAIAQRLTTADPANARWQHDLAIAHERVAAALFQQGDLAGALAEYESRRGILDRLVEAQPNDAEWLIDLAIAHREIGDILQKQGKLDSALENYQTQLDISERLTQADPDKARWQSELAAAYSRIGNVLVLQRRFDDAIGRYRKSLAIYSKLATADPGDAGWQRALSVSHNKIADVLLAQGNVTAALESYRAALAIREHLTKTDPGNAEFQRDLAFSHGRIGFVLSATGNLEGALESYRAEYAITERLALAEPGNAARQADLASSCGHLGVLYAKMGRRDEALAILRKGRAIIAALVDSGNVEWKRFLEGFDSDIAALEK